MKVRALLVMACLAGAGTAVAGEALPALEVRAHRVEISPGDLDGLVLRGTVSLNADHDAFGGFSGLVVDADRMIAVTDQGWWLEAAVEDGPRGLRPGQARFGPMRGADGETFDKAGGDAEALTRLDGRIIVGLERDHRVMVHREDGRLGDAIRDRSFERLSTNKGIEALYTPLHGGVRAIEERPRRGHHMVFLIDRAGEVGTWRLPATGDFHVTGADVGPDGRLYLLLRDYGRFTGVSIRVHRYDLGSEGLPVVASLREMAAFESESGIDNMEGLATWLDKAGRTRLTLISDDNFNLIQRTLLMDFEVTEEAAARSPEISGTDGR